MSNEAESLTFFELLVGLPHFWTAPDSYLMKLHNRYGDIIELPDVLGEPILLLSRPSHVKHVFLTHHQNYDKAGLFQPVFELAFGSGLVNANGATWRRRRRLLQPHFQPDALAGFIDAIADRARARVEAWKRRSETDAKLDLEAEMLDLSGEIISTTVLGLPIGHELRQARRAFLKAAPLTYLPEFIARRACSSVQSARDDLGVIVLEALDQIRHADPAPPVLAAELLRARDPRTGRGMDENALVDELITLLFTGYETTAQALTWVWFLLISNPDCRAQLRQEIERHSASPKHINFKSISRMPHMDRVINESLRLYPPVWATGRRAVGPDQIDGHQVAPGTRVILSQFLTHRRADVWHDPLTFKPQRFDEGVQGPQLEYRYYPFGGGPRRCIGMHLSLIEIKVILAVMVPAVSLALSGPAPEIGRPSVTMRPAKPIRVELR